MVGGLKDGVPWHLQGFEEAAQVVQRHRLEVLPDAEFDHVNVRDIEPELQWLVQSSVLGFAHVL